MTPGWLRFHTAVTFQTMRTEGLKLFLLLVAGASACLPPGGNRRPAPRPADSIFAKLELQNALLQFVSHAREEDLVIRLRLGQPTDRLPSAGERQLREEARLARAAVRRMDEVDVDALTEDDYVTLLSTRAHLSNAADATLYFDLDLSDLSVGGSPLRLAQRIMGAHPLRHTADTERYLYLAFGVPILVDSLRGNAERRAERGVVMPAAARQRTVAWLRLMIQPPEASPFGVAPERTAGLDTALAAAFHAELTMTITSAINPALQRLIDYLDGPYAARAPAADGLWQFVGGKDYYRFLVRKWTTLDVTPEQVHEVGVREMARIDSAMQIARVAMGFTGTRQAFHDSLRRDPRTAPLTADSLLQRLLDGVERLQARIDSVAAGGHRNPAVVRWNPGGTDGDDVTLGSYDAPLDNGGAAVFNATDAMIAAGATSMVDALSFYALVPGRHTLDGHENREGLSVARRYAPAPAMSEGWGLYATTLANEWGGYSDSLQAYGRLALEMLAATRLVIDTGLHYLGWSRAQCVDVLLQQTVLSPAAAEREVARMAEEAPGRSLAGGMGVRELRAMRRLAERTLKTDFNANRFHRMVLTTGSVPLPVMSTHLEYWLYQERVRIRDAARAPSLPKKE